LRIFKLKIKSKGITLFIALKVQVYIASIFSNLNFIKNRNVSTNP